jgi:hypothetical protein
LAPPPCWKLLLGFFSLHILLLFFQPPGLLFLNTFLQVIAKRWGNTWTLSSRISLLHPQTLHRWFFSSPMALNTQKCWLDNRYSRERRVPWNSFPLGTALNQWLQAVKG